MLAAATGFATMGGELLLTADWWRRVTAVGLLLLLKRGDVPEPLDRGKRLQPEMASTAPCISSTVG